ncbi:MFS transporter [Streptomyces sp. NPDC002018]|uniref:MFS transporter n=1 Tax=Streptomyces sp. NPDC002018 TaxID=3364629 RepID=UPI0036A02E02
MLFTTVSYLGAALRLTGIRKTPAPPAPSPGHATRLREQIAEGVRHVFGNRELRALALTAALGNFGSQIINTMLPVVFVRELGYSAGALGLFWAVGGAGLLIGARCARPIAARLGYGPTLGIAGLCLAPAGLLVPLVDRGPWLVLAGTGWLHHPRTPRFPNPWRPPGPEATSPPPLSSGSSPEWSSASPELL